MPEIWWIEVLAVYRCLVMLILAGATPIRRHVGVLLYRAAPSDLPDHVTVRDWSGVCVGLVGDRPQIAERGECQSFNRSRERQC